MIHNSRLNLFLRLINIALLITGSLFGINWSTKADALAQKPRAKAVNAYAEQMPLYRDYKGVRIGMTTEETRTRLGQPVQKADDQDFYVFSEKETAQVCYDASHKVVTISVDYQGEGNGAPEYRAVVGASIETRPDGSLYKMVRYENLGFWVSYNRTSGNLPIVTVTIQKIK